MTKLTIEKILYGIEEVKRGNTPLGLRLLEPTIGLPDLPKAKAWYGYCLAREKKQFSTGVNLCKEALKKSPRNAEIYLALGRVYLLSGRRDLAIDCLNLGRKMDRNHDIDRLLKTIGIRKQPVFSFLDRSNLLNVTSGRLLRKFGLR